MRKDCVHLGSLPLLPLLSPIECKNFANSIVTRYPLGEYGELNSLQALGIFLSLSANCWHFVIRRRRCTIAYTYLSNSNANFRYALRQPPTCINIFQLTLKNFLYAVNHPNVDYHFSKIGILNETPAAYAYIVYLFNKRTHKYQQPRNDRFPMGSFSIRS